MVKKENLYYQKMKNISDKKNVDIIINPFNLDFGNKKFINAIYTELQEIAQNETNYKSTN